MWLGCCDSLWYLGHRGILDKSNGYGKCPIQACEVNCIKCYATVVFYRKPLWSSPYLNHSSFLPDRIALLLCKLWMDTPLAHRASIVKQRSGELITPCSHITKANLVSMFTCTTWKCVFCFADFLWSKTPHPHFKSCSVAEAGRERAKLKSVLTESVLVRLFATYEPTVLCKSATVYVNLNTAVIYSCSLYITKYIHMNFQFHLMPIDPCEYYKLGL